MWAAEACRPRKEADDERRRLRRLRKGAARPGMEAPDRAGALRRRGPRPDRVPARRRRAPHGDRRLRRHRRAGAGRHQRRAQRPQPARRPRRQGAARRRPGPPGAGLRRPRRRHGEGRRGLARRPSHRPPGDREGLHERVAVGAVRAGGALEEGVHGRDGGGLVVGREVAPEVAPHRLHAGAVGLRRHDAAALLGPDVLGLQARRPEVAGEDVRVDLVVLDRVGQAAQDRVAGGAHQRHGLAVVRGAGRQHAEDAARGERPSHARDRGRAVGEPVQRHRAEHEVGARVVDPHAEDVARLQVGLDARDLPQALPEDLQHGRPTR